MGSAKEAEEMYLRLVQWYTKHSLTPRKEVERRIAEKVAQGKTREEAIRELYEEEKRASIELTQPKPKVPLTGLEASLEPLRQAGNPAAAFGLALFLATSLLAMAIFLSQVVAIAAGAFIIAAVSIPIVVLLTARTDVSWKFEEEIVVRGAGEKLQEVIEAVPKAFQALTLEETAAQIDANRLHLTVKLTKAVTEVGRYGSAYTRSVDLGRFSVDATFGSRDGDLVVKASYSGKPPAEYASLAAEEYERLVVAFRSAVEEAWVKVKPKVVAVLDFARLAELIASRGLVIAAVQCPYCGGSVDLPKDGDTVKCRYCGTTLKAIEVYELIKKLIKELA